MFFYFHNHYLWSTYLRPAMHTELVYFFWFMVSFYMLEPKTTLLKCLILGSQANGNFLNDLETITIPATAGMSEIPMEVNVGSVILLSAI